MKSGWVTKKLGEVCEEIKERIPSNQVALSAYITTDNMRKNCAGVCEAENLPPKVSSLVCYQDDDILLSNIRPYLKKVWLADRCGGASSDVIVLRPHCEYVLPRYIFQSLARDDFFDFVMLNVTGTKMPRGKREWIKDFELPIPPLAEQERIVAKIDAAFEKIDKLKANAEKNLANAKELFQAALDEAMRPKDGWVEKRLGEVCDVQLGKMLDKAKNKGEPYPYLANLSVRWRDFDLSNLRTMPFTDSEVVKFSLIPGDVLMCEGGEPGRCAVWKIRNSNIKYQKAIHRIRSRGDVEPAYIVAYFESIIGTVQFQSCLTGATIKHLPRERLVDICIPFPSLSEQREIVNRLDLLAEKIKTIEQNYTQQIADCVEMRQAVLREAFEGRL